MIKTIDLSDQYLEHIAQILGSYDDILNVKVILPSVASCVKLQHLLILKAKNGACLLPQIVPIINIGIGSEGVYNIPKESIEPISFLEQKIMIAEIIRKIQSNLTIAQSLGLSNHIIRLFDELVTYDIQLPALYKASAMNDAEHWQYMLAFLLDIHAKWRDVQDTLQKTDMVGYRQNMIALTIEAAKSNASIIMAGIIPRGKLIKELAAVISKSKNGVLILPQMNIGKCQANVPVTSKLWVHNSIVETLPEDLIHQNVTLPSTPQHYIMDIAPNLLSEAKIIAEKAQSWFTDGADKVAIVTQNSDLIEMVSNLLHDVAIDQININGYRLYKTKQYEFFMLLIKAFDSLYGLHLENLISLLKSPYLFSDNVVEFEYNLRKKQISSDQELSKFLARESMSKSFLDPIKCAYANNIFVGQRDISEILTMHIKLAEELVPTIWNGDEGKVFAELLYDLLNVEHLPTCNIKDYIEFLEHTMSGARYFKKLSEQPVLFMNLEDASLGGYQYVICSDMNEGSMPQSMPYDPWMNTQMRLTIGLPDVAENIGIQWYYFSNLLHRKNIYLTRSSKVGGSETVASRFWRELYAGIGDSVDKSHFRDSASRLQESHDIIEIPRQGSLISYKSPQFINKHHDGVLQINFPTKISATNLELLIRNPYGFYAKYILGLRKLENVFEQNTLAKFGNFLHKTIEEYTEQYIGGSQDRYAFIMEIGSRIANEYSKNHINLWWPKFSNVMREFIEFDYARRVNDRVILSEIYGEMPITIGNHTVNITAIADRVEQDLEGNIYILDYKTGALPTKQDVLRGISVQMLVEAMIVDAGGFKEVQGKAYELTYVKIASRSPYIETVTYKVDELDLSAHKDGLCKIVEYYMKGEFVVNDNPQFAPKYDDYKHLARKEG